MIHFFKPYIFFTGTFRILSYRSLLNLLLALPFTLTASGPKQGREFTWHLSGVTGIAMLSGEVTNNLVFLPNEFRHKPGIAYTLNAGLNLGSRWEPALRIGAYTIGGDSYLKNLSAAGYQHDLSEDRDNEPVEYITQSTSVSVVVRYHLRKPPRRHQIVSGIYPFVEAGAGINSFTSELRYQTIPDGIQSALIFKKSDGEYAVGVAQIVTGVGTKIGTYNKWNFIVLWNADWVKHDSFDAVHNFNNGERTDAGAIVSKFTAGISIPVNRNSKKNNYLPFRR